MSTLGAKSQLYEIVGAVGWVAPKFIQDSKGEITNLLDRRNDQKTLKLAKSGKSGVWSLILHERR